MDDSDVEELGRREIGGKTLVLMLLMAMKFAYWFNASRVDEMRLRTPAFERALGIPLEWCSFGFINMIKFTMF